MTEINTTPIHQTTTFISACRTFFGLKQGQQLREFADEVKQLTPQDRQDFTAMFRTVGIDATKV